MQSYKNLAPFIRAQRHSATVELAQIVLEALRRYHLFNLIIQGHRQRRRFRNGLGPTVLELCRNSMKDFPRNFKVLPSVGRHRALSDANLQHDSARRKRCQTPPCCGQSTILQLFFVQAIPCKKHSPKKRHPKTQTAYSRAVAGARFSSQKDLETFNFPNRPTNKHSKLEQTPLENSFSRKVCVMFRHLRNRPYKTPARRLALARKFLQTHGPVRTPSPKTRVGLRPSELIVLALHAFVIRDLRVTRTDTALDFCVVPQTE